jgi:hypothetical protein
MIAGRNGKRPDAFAIGPQRYCIRSAAADGIRSAAANRAAPAATLPHPRRRAGEAGAKEGCPCSAWERSPRGTVATRSPHTKRARRISPAGSRRYYCRQRPTLPHSSPCSTIGGIRLNFRVRNGNGCDPDPMTTGKLAGCLVDDETAKPGAWGPTPCSATHKRRIGSGSVVPDYLFSKTFSKSFSGASVFELSKSVQHVPPPRGHN